MIVPTNIIKTTLNMEIIKLILIIILLPIELISIVATIISFIFMAIAGTISQGIYTFIDKLNQSR